VRKISFLKRILLHRFKYFGAVFAYSITVNLPNLIPQDFRIDGNVRQAVFCRQVVVCDIFPSHFEIRMGRAKIPTCHLWVLAIGLHCYRGNIKSHHH
jgi:hypothetical protein